MSSNQFDLAVFGSGPSALYLAALLAEGQTRRIVLIHNPATRVRLPRSFELSAGFIARPETWRLLTAGSAETARRLSTAGLGGALERTRLTLARTGASGRFALGHVRALASAHGAEIQRASLPPNPEWDATGHAAHGLLLREVWRFAPERAHDAFLAWHNKLGIERLPRAQTDEIAIGRDGSLRLTAGSQRIAAELAVLADDEFILDFAGGAELEAGFRIEQRTALLTAPTADRLPDRAAFLLAEDFALHQAPSGAIAAVGAGAPGPLAERILRLLPALASASIAGRARFAGLASLDGAPQIGRGKSRRAFVVGGLGETGFFLMPSLARFIAGAAEGHEKAFWSARAIGRDAATRVDEIAAPLAGAA